MHLIILIVLLPRKLSPNLLSFGKLLLIQVIFWFWKAVLLFGRRQVLENNCICRKVGRGCKGLRYYLSYLDGDASHCVICIYYHNISEGSWQEIRRGHATKALQKLSPFRFSVLAQGKGLSLYRMHF